MATPQAIKKASSTENHPNHTPIRATKKMQAANKSVTIIKANVCLLMSTISLKQVIYAYRGSFSLRKSCAWCGNKVALLFSRNNSGGTSQPAKT